ncbi:MAG: hypothetical protein DMF78_23825 [Acidobacteria bacterium]|nr:MAG: hypothetical protein DMF78_23825 [Acidobacteriota bacterium]
MWRQESPRRSSPTTAACLTVGAALVLDLRLDPGGLQETVSVTTETPSVDTSTPTLSAVVGGETLRELPLNGRDWTSLATLQPGVVSIRTQAVNGVTASRGNRGYGDELTVAGHRPQENNYRLDGVSINDYSNGAPGSAGGVNLGVDAIQEFSVLTSNYSAEYGRTSGGVINAVTRSGTNALHGSGYEFLRNDALDARNYFDKAPTKAPLTRNQFGASLGAPIRKDKTFFFVDYEGIRLTEGVTAVATVPSPAARQGRLSTGTVTVDPAIARYLDFWPLPNGALLGAGDVPDALQNEFFGNLTTRTMVGLEETHTFSQNFTNAIRIGYSRTKAFVNDEGAAINPIASDLNLGTAPGRAAAIISVPGLTLTAGGVGGNSFFRHIQNSYQLYDDAFVSHGNHSIRLGFAFERIEYNELGLRMPNGRFNFGSLSDFLTNQPNNFFGLDPARSQEAQVRASIFAGYVNDGWRVRPRLTLNYGLRYEMSTKPKDAQGRLTVVRDLNGGPIVTVDSYFETNPTLKNFEPRVGFAWDPGGRGRSAIRGGFGVYDVLPLPWIFTPKSAQGTPFNVGITVRNLPQGSFPKQAFGLANFNAATADSLYVEPNPKRNYILNWNLTVQQRLVQDVTLTASYVGSRGVHNAFVSDDANVVLPIGQTPDGRLLFPTPSGSGTRVNPSAGTLRSNWWNGDSHYHGLQVQAIKAMSHGFLAQLSYTWSKCTDTGSAASRGDQFTNGITNPMFFERAHRIGPCDFNVAHVGTLNTLWQLPGPKSGLASAVLGNWELGAIVSASTGTPFSVLIGGDPLGLKGTDSNGWPNLADTPECKNPVNPGNAAHYIKTECFTVPSPITSLGTSGRNIATGPGLFSLDLAAYKSIAIAGSVRAQIRVEAFNVLNHPNFAPPLANTAVFNQSGQPVANAGLITTTQTTARQIQLGIRTTW